MTIYGASGTTSSSPQSLTYRSKNTNSHKFPQWTVRIFSALKSFFVAGGFCVTELSMLMIRLRKRKIDILAEALEYRINCEPDILISKANLKDYIEAVIHRREQIRYEERYSAIMAGKIVMCPKCGKNFVDIDGVSEHLGEKPICPECKAKAGRFLRIIVAIAEKAGAAGQAIAETYKELGGELLEKANTMRHTASDIYRERQESKAQERAARLRRREEAQERKAMLRKEIIVTALHSVACQVRRNLGYVSANLYVELKDKSDKAITAIIDAKEEELLDELRLKAHQLGANAIIGLNVSKSITTIHDRAGRAVIGGLFSAYGNALEIAIRPKSPAQ